MVDELSIESVAYARYSWLKKVVWTCMVCLIFLDEPKVGVVKFFANCIYCKSVALRVTEGA